MPEKKNFRLPVHLLILDAIGAIALALGLLDWITGSKIVPQSLQFNNYEITLIVVGIILMLPLVFFVINKILGRYPREI